MKSSLGREIRQYTVIPAINTKWNRWMLGKRYHVRTSQVNNPKNPHNFSNFVHILDTKTNVIYFRRGHAKNRWFNFGGLPLKVEDVLSMEGGLEDEQHEES